MSKQTISLDFDGVIHSYASGWAGYVPTDPPVRGAREAIARMRELGFRVVVHSSRCAMQEGIQGVRAWLEQHGIEVDDVSRDKPQAVLIVDDRGFRFEGDWQPVLERIERGDFSPWNKKPRLTISDPVLDEQVGSVRVMCFAAASRGWELEEVGLGEADDVFLEVQIASEPVLIRVPAAQRERLAQLIAPPKVGVGG